MLVTLLRPTGGSATVGGYDIVSEPGRVRSVIGVALQEAALDPLMSARELMELQAELHGVPRSETVSRSSMLIERVGLEEAQHRRVGTYSGGMRRRLDLAMALVHDPEVLFLDEPTTGLDPTSRFTLWEEVRRLKGEGRTVFLTTQYLEEADQLADRVGIISGGRIVAEGTPAALKAEIGAPRLEISLADGGDPVAAGAALGAFGELVPPGPGATLAVTVEGGATEIAGVVRALDNAGFAVASLELHSPTLDDVFAEKTGRRLEGAGEDAPAPEPEALADPA
jgi:ABC-2 type transport system ATP-binding protein